jgi:hypothetical protein
MMEFDRRQLSGLEWHQESAFGRKYNLKSGDSVLAEVAFVKTLGTLAEARTAGNAWTFKRKGVFSSSVGARPLGEEREVATYQPNWTSSKGLMRLDSGEAFQLRSANFWASEWLLSDMDGIAILRFHNRGFLKHGAQIDIEEKGRSHPQLELLLTLTWYILVLHQMDSTVVAAGA